MDKIREFVEGVRFLAPGIVVALIFYMYADVKFDQFGFLLFCAVAIIFVSALTDAFFGMLGLLHSLGYWAALTIYKKTSKGRSRSTKSIKQMYSRARKALEFARLPGQFSLALVLGVFVVNFYEGDSFFKALSSFVKSPKISLQDTNDRVLKRVVQKEFDYIDDRPTTSHPCSPPDPGCFRDVYLKIKTKQADFYEGAMRYYPMKLEVQGFYVSPACVSRIQDRLYAPLERVSGPGVYLPIADVAAIEYVDAISSDCFKLYYPALWKARP